MRGWCLPTGLRSLSQGALKRAILGKKCAQHNRHECVRIHGKVPGAGAHEYLQNVAVSRILLDNVVNFQASWPTMGYKVAQTALFFGCNDFGSTMMEENIVSPTGTNFLMQIDEIRRLIREAGYEPRVRDTLYHLLD